MNAVRNNWKRRVRCRLLQRSHFLVPCKYCITETPAVSCRLGIPHNSEMSTLTENLSQDQIVTRVWTSLLWTEPVFDWFQIQLFVLVFFLEKTKLNQISSGVFSVFFFFAPDIHKEGENDVKGVTTPAASAAGVKCNRRRTSRSLNKSKSFTTTSINKYWNQIKGPVHRFYTKLSWLHIRLYGGNLEEDNLWCCHEVWGGGGSFQFITERLHCKDAGVWLKEGWMNRFFSALWEM